VVPDLETLQLGRKRDWGGALVIAAKTTLRERWKQVSSESLHCPVFLATVDDRIPQSTIEELASLQITLVVPEGLKQSNETAYKVCSDVISFRMLFDKELAPYRCPHQPNNARP
jgi:hypothetical protein